MQRGDGAAVTLSDCRRFAFHSTVAVTVSVFFLYANSVMFAAPAVDVEPLPPDLPLPASSPNPSPWLREAIVLQPYGHSEFTAITEAATTTIVRNRMWANPFKDDQQAPTVPTISQVRGGHLGARFPANVGLWRGLDTERCRRWGVLTASR